MKLFCLGFNHQTAPVEIREKLAFDAADIPPAGKRALSQGVVKEMVVLSTCNRVEVYAVTEGREDARAQLENVLLHRSPEHDASPLRAHMYCHEREAAVRHLFEVVSGLDSMVLGETEIFGQAKQAYDLAMGEGLTGKVLNRLFQKAFQTGKEVRTTTNITRGNVSVGSAAVTLAEKIFEKLEDLVIMVIGAGEMSERTARAFQLRGARKLHIVNRSLDKAQALAAELGGEADALGNWRTIAAGADIIVSSTSSPEYVVHHQDIVSILSKRTSRPLFLIDLAVPRDIDPSVNWVDNCYLYNIDDLKAIADESARLREQDIQRCREIVQAKLDHVTQWLGEHAKI